MGRPKKYTPRTLKTAVEKYFDSISREIAMTEKVDTGERDKSGHKIYKDEPVLNKCGEQVKITEYLVPPTVDCARLWRFTEVPGRNIAIRNSTRSFQTRQRARGGVCGNISSSSF